MESSNESPSDKKARHFYREDNGIDGDPSGRPYSYDSQQRCRWASLPGVVMKSLVARDEEGNISLLSNGHIKKMRQVSSQWRYEVDQHVERVQLRVASDSYDSFRYYRANIPLGPTTSAEPGNSRRFPPLAFPSA
eukprot:scaffold66094_cov35-Prasinocladus_malaysianus.AAC.1